MADKIVVNHNFRASATSEGFLTASEDEARVVMRTAGDDVVEAVIGEQNDVAPLSTGVAEERAERRGANFSAAGQTAALGTTVEDSAAMAVVLRLVYRQEVRDVAVAVSQDSSGSLWLARQLRWKRVFWIPELKREQQIDAESSGKDGVAHPLRQRMVDEDDSRHIIGCQVHMWIALTAEGNCVEKTSNSAPQLIEQQFRI